MLRGCARAHVISSNISFHLVSCHISRHLSEIQIISYYFPSLHLLFLSSYIFLSPLSLFLSRSLSLSLSRLLSLSAPHLSHVSPLCDLPPPSCFSPPFLSSFLISLVIGNKAAAGALLQQLTILGSHGAPVSCWKTHHWPREARQANK